MRTRCLVRSTLLPLALALGAALSAALGTPLPAQTPATVSGTDRFHLTAKSTGVTYRIDVSLPPGLDDMKIRPPLFVITDANLAFNTVHEAVTMLGISGEIAPVIVVGVGYPETDGRGYTPAYAASRTRDYTPSDVKAMPGGGGSAAFFSFLEHELVPMLESKYRADTTRRGLGGHSLGGLFATYALLQHPGFFTRYWIGSPSLWWDNLLPFTWLPTTKQGATQPNGRAYVTVGAKESAVMVPPARRLAAELKRSFPALRVGSQVYPDESHGSVVGGAISRALRFLYGDFGRPTVLLSPAARAEYTGDWSSPNVTIRLRPAATGVQMSLTYTGQTITDTLYAASRDTLFSAGGTASQFVALRGAKGRITALKGTLLGATMEYVRGKK
ncbi:MAG: alpha/beta hydrolase [Gemmatimonadaceae bacterium]|nr:alpha/beta hydrolase [Gemmatimonadaceae bacterium]